MKTVISFGEVLWDLLPTGPELGGAPLNFAYRMLALGNRVLLASRRGDDVLGDALSRKTIDLGVCQDFIQVDDSHPTGTVRISFQESGTADIVIERDVAYDYIGSSEALLNEARAAACVCFGTVAQRNEVSRNTLHRVLGEANGSLRVFDLNLRRDCFTDDIVERSFEHANVVKLNEDEVNYVAGMLHVPAAPLPIFCERLLAKWPISCCVVTLESRGAFAATSKSELVYSPAFRVQFADPLGAGDAFTAGFVHGLLQGKPIAACLKYGNAMGAIVASQCGATGAMHMDWIDTVFECGARHGCDQQLAQYLVDDEGITGSHSCSERGRTLCR